MTKPLDCSSVEQALSYANYIETLMDAELQWINNRVSWLFISQTFCIMAYTVLLTSKEARFAGNNAIDILKLGLPAFGVVCCAVVGIAVLSATRVATSLAKERAGLVLFLNGKGPGTIPMIGVGGDLSDKGWLYWCGEMPHRLLPWVLGLLWLLLLTA